MKPTSSWKVFKHMKHFKLFFFFWKFSTNCREFVVLKTFKKLKQAVAYNSKSFRKPKPEVMNKNRQYTKHWLQPCCVVIVNLDLWFQFYRSGTMICCPHLSREFSMAATLNKGQPSGWLKEAHGHESHTYSFSCTLAAIFSVCDNTRRFWIKMFNVGETLFNWQVV